MKNGRSPYTTSPPQDGDAASGLINLDGRDAPRVLNPRWMQHTPLLKSPRMRSINGDANTIEPFIIGVTGASASGKTTVCEKIIQGLSDNRCVLISLDWFYHGLPDDLDDIASYNFDHPDAFDFAALKNTLIEMKKKQPVTIPKYDFTKHQRDPDNAAELHAADVIIVEGILALYDKDIRNMMHMKLFVDEELDICLARRLQRDVSSRGRTVESVLVQYNRHVRPAFLEFIFPTKRFADVVIPRGGQNLVAIDLIVKHLALKIEQDDLRKLYPNLIVLADAYQTRGLHTIMRDRTTSRDDFVFYSNRLMRLLVEEALGLLPFDRKKVTTETGATYYGVSFVAGLAAVSLLPAGTAMESSVRAVCNTLRIGKLLVGDDRTSVTYENLPDGLQDRFMLVLVPVLNTGRSCETAVERLIAADIGCKEDRVIVIALIVSPQAVQRLCGRFPGMRLVVTAVDEGLDEREKITPGVGDFERRYFGM